MESVRLVLPLLLRRAHHAVYTPQAVVRGQSQLVGSDASKILAAARQVATKPEIALPIIDFEQANNRLKGRVAGTIPPQTTPVAALAAVLRGKTLAAVSPTSLSSAACSTSIPLATSISKTFPARRVSSSTSSRPSNAKPLAPSNPG